jgi:hypothetical protein
VTASGALQKRIRRLEESGADAGGGCDRCCGVLVIVNNVITGEFHSASWRGEEMSEVEVCERRAETRCSRCGRKLDSDEAPVIEVGGLRP